MVLKQNKTQKKENQVSVTLIGRRENRSCERMRATGEKQETKQTNDSKSALNRGSKQNIVYKKVKKGKLKNNEKWYRNTINLL